MKYLVSMEGNYGYPEGDFNNHCTTSEDDLEKIVREYLIPYFENWISEDEKEEDVIKKTINESSFYFENTGYGEELFIKIEKI